MKLLIFSTIFGFAIDTATGQEYSVGTLISSSKTRAAVDLICTKTGPECAKDGSTLMICGGYSKAPITSSVCSSPNQYCVAGACTRTPGPDATVTGISFTCTEDGVFPEPSDCTQYRVCEKGEAELFQCPKGFNFNSQLNVCQTGFACSKIDCSRVSVNNPYILYKSNPAYYAYCFIHETGVIQTLMFKCQNEQFEVFDINAKVCKFKCRAKGNFQNPANCQEYYYCSSANAQPITLICAPKFVFDGTGCNNNKDTCQYRPIGNDNGNDNNENGNGNNENGNENNENSNGNEENGNGNNENSNGNNENGNGNNENGNGNEENGNGNNENGNGNEENGNGNNENGNGNNENGNENNENGNGNNENGNGNNENGNGNNENATGNNENSNGNNQNGIGNNGI